MIDQFKTLDNKFMDLEYHDHEITEWFVLTIYVNVFWSPSGVHTIHYVFMVFTTTCTHVHWHHNKAFVLNYTTSLLKIQDPQSTDFKALIQGITI